MDIFQVMAEKKIEVVDFVHNFKAGKIVVDPIEIEDLAPGQCDFVKDILLCRGGGHERLTLWLKGKVRVSICIHDSLLGFPLGGTRWREDYENERAMILDNADLAEGMSGKGFWSGTGTSGSKVVIWAPLSEKTPEFLEAYGEFLAKIGSNITAEDMNMGPKDCEIIARKTNLIAGLPDKSGDPSPKTAFGVFVSMRRILKDIRGIKSFANVPIAIEGVTGGVGSNLAELLAKAGADITGSYHNSKKKAEEMAERLGIKIVRGEEIFFGDYEVLSLNATGKRLNAKTVPYIKRGTIICGGANNQLDDPRDYWGDELWKKGCWYGPDFVVNFGGLYNVCDERRDGGYSEARVMSRIEKIGDANIAWLLQRAVIEDASPHRIADRLPRSEIKRLREEKTGY